MIGRQGPFQRLSHRREGVVCRVVRASSSSRFARRGRRFGRRRFFDSRHRRILFSPFAVLLFLVFRAILVNMFWSSLVITGGGNCRRRIASRRCNAVLKSDRSVQYAHKSNSSVAGNLRLAALADPCAVRQCCAEKNSVPTSDNCPPQDKERQSRTIVGGSIVQIRVHVHDTQRRIFCVHICRFRRSRRVPLSLLALILARRRRLSPIFCFRLFGPREQALLARSQLVPRRLRRRESRRGRRRGRRRSAGRGFLDGHDVDEVGLIDLDGSTIPGDESRELDVGAVGA